MIPAGLPLWVRLLLSGAALGLAWWRFGTGRAGGRRPGLVWAAGFAAGAIVVGGDGAAWLLQHGAGAWLPVCGVGLLGCFPLIRGRWRGEPLAGRRRAWYAAAAGLIVLGPPVALLDRIEAARRTAERTVTEVLPSSVLTHWGWDLLSEIVRAVLIGAAAAAIGTAAWGRSGHAAGPQEGGGVE